MEFKEFKKLSKGSDSFACQIYTKDGVYISIKEDLEKLEEFFDEDILFFKGVYKEDKSSYRAVTSLPYGGLCSISNSKLNTCHCFGWTMLEVLKETFHIPMQRIVELSEVIYKEYAEEQMGTVFWDKHVKYLDGRLAELCFKE